MKCCEFETNENTEILDKEIELNLKIKPHPNILRFYKFYKWETKSI